MGTLKEKLSYLSETKEAIKQALIKQQVTVTDEDTFRSYADKIAGIEGGGGSIQKIDAGENETELPYGEIRAISIVDFQVVYYINEKTHPQMYKEIGDIVFEMAMDTYGHYFSGIVVLVEVEPNTYKMIEK